VFSAIIRGFFATIPSAKIPTLSALGRLPQHPLLANILDFCGGRLPPHGIKRARDCVGVVHQRSGKWTHHYCGCLLWMEEHFDSVVAGEIIEHIFDTDLFLNNIYKVLKKNGTLILSTPNIASLARRIMLLLGINPLIEVTARRYDAGHIRYFTFKSLKNLLYENDFSIMHFTSDSINFDNKAFFKSKILAEIFPTFGKTLIIKAAKKI
jgi:SAM-dependent methyltransferase